MNIKHLKQIKDMAAINPNGIARKRANINNQKNLDAEQIKNQKLELTYEYAEKIYPILKSVEKECKTSIKNVFDTIDLLIENDFWNEFCGFEEDESTKNNRCSFGVSDDKKRIYFEGDNLEMEFYLPNEYYKDINACAALLKIGKFDSYDILIQEKDIQIMLEDSITADVADGKIVYTDTNVNEIKSQFDKYLNDFNFFKTCVDDYVNDFKEWVDIEFPEVDE